MMIRASLGKGSANKKTSSTKRMLPWHAFQGPAAFSLFQEGRMGAGVANACLGLALPHRLGGLGMVNRRQKHVYKSFASGRVELGIPFCIREHAKTILL